MKTKRTLSIRSARYVRLMRRLVLGPGSPKSVSYHEEILCPEERQYIEPPIYLSGQFERLTGATEHQPLAAEVDSMLANEYTHAATIAYHIKDAVLVDGSVYAGNLRHFIADRATVRSGAEPHHFKVAGLASTTIGSRYFGHWLQDDCIQYLLAGQTGTSICIGNHPAWKHKAKYASYFGQDWTPTECAYVDDLAIYQDFGQNSLKRHRYKLLTSKLESRFSNSAERLGLVYLRRGKAGISRLIQDEETLLKSLMNLGFTVVDVEDDLDLILRALGNAKLVVSIEGSHVAHCCYSLIENCGLLVLQPADRFTAVHRHWTGSVGIHFGFVVGTPSELGYRFSPKEVLYTIEKMLNRIELQKKCPLPTSTPKASMRSNRP